MNDKSSNQGLDPQVIGVLRRAVELVAAGRPITLAGEEVMSDDVVSPSFLLPALLVRASEDHAIARAAGATTAFHISMESDRAAFLGVRVTGFETTSLGALVLPVINAVRRGGDGRSHVAVDEMVETFGTWMVLNGRQPAAEAELEPGPEPGVGA